MEPAKQPGKDTMVTDVNTPASALATEQYVTKGVLFMVIMAVVLFVARRRRSHYEKLDEKSMA